MIFKNFLFFISFYQSGIIFRVFKVLSGEERREGPLRQRYGPATALHFSVSLVDANFISYQLIEFIGKSRAIFQFLASFDD